MEKHIGLNRCAFILVKSFEVSFNKSLFRNAYSFQLYFFSIVEFVYLQSKCNFSSMG